jgi:hypothetical protein
VPGRTSQGAAIAAHRDSARARRPAVHCGVREHAGLRGLLPAIRTGTAFVWRSSANPQLQLLADVLLTAGANLSGWTLEHASGVSADGSTVVGYGMHNGVREGFIARLR